MERRHGGQAVGQRFWIGPVSSAAQGAGDLAGYLLDECREVLQISARGRLHLGAGGDEPPQRRLLAHEARVVHHVLRRGDGVRQAHEIGLAPLEAPQHAARLQLVGDGHEIQ